MDTAQFTYNRFTIDEARQTVSFFYSVSHAGDTHSFTEVLKFPVMLPETSQTQHSLRALHIALGISYYKIFIPPVITHPYTMDEAETEFWNDIFTNGLGEFLYTNKLSASQLATFTPQNGTRFEETDNWQPTDTALLGIGGGKDSVVAGELLKQAGVMVEGFVMATGEQLGQSKSVTDTMHISMHAVERSLDKQMLVLQERPDAYRGHIPISLIFGLVGAVLATAKDASYVVVANESSASIPRVEWQGNSVNHQWSKSFGFEKKLQTYLHRMVSPKLTYFSAIRPLNNVAIMKLFAGYPQYFEVFTSDNSVFRIDPSKRPNGRWSLESPKSLSSFILLSPWLTEKDLVRTFGRNFMDEASLEHLFYELVGLEDHQPLDCVGTVEELVLSLTMSKQQGKWSESYLMQKAQDRGLLTDRDVQQELQTMLELSPEHVIPTELSVRLLPLLTGPAEPLERFRGKEVVFVGVGQGRAMTGIQEYLTKHAAVASFNGVDKQSGDKPLAFLSDYDPTQTVFIKNEGIPSHEMPVPYITQLQVFFELAAQKNLLTVGITGTKGKSTTTALAAHILETAGKDVVLAGNIGVSPLMALDTASPETIFVLELSSYQLSDLPIGPHISAAINLYNDHTDWHGSLENYWEAKRNIMRFAASDDIFIYNPDFEALQTWASNATCQTRPIDPRESYDFTEAQLFGDHNRLNILVARQIARELGISDDTTHQAVLSFKPLEHRMQIVATKHEVTYIDDAIGMTPESTLASLSAVTEKYGPLGCLLLGGQDRNYDFTALMQTIAQANIPNLVLFPDTTEKMKQAIPEGYRPRIHETGDMKEAVQFACEHSPSGSVVLLSTAAPSYSVWRDFEDKGNQFKQAVEAI